MSSLKSVNNIVEPGLSRSLKNSKKSESIRSVHGSKFGRSVNRFPVKNELFNTNTISTINSRIVPTFFSTLSKSKPLPSAVSASPTELIRELGDIFEILDYEFNYVSFWLLDVFAKILKEVQERNIPESQQILFLFWLRFVLRSISICGCSREEMFMYLQDVFISAVSIIKGGKSIPLPEEVSIDTDNEVSQEISSQLIKMSSILSADIDVTSTKKRSRSFPSNSHTSSLEHRRRSSRKSSKSNSTSKTELDGLCSEEKISLNLKTFYSIVDTIYQVFADRYTFKLISMAYSTPATVTPVDVLIDFNEPKQPKPEPIIIPEIVESPKGRKGSKTKGGAKTAKKSKKGNNTEILKQENKDEQGDSVKEDKGKGKNKDKSKKKEKGDKKSGKAKKSIEKERISLEKKKTSIDEREVILEKRRQLFDRNKDLKTEKELELQNKNYLLPLSEAVGKDFVKNLMKTIMPEEIKEVHEKETNKEKVKKSSIKSDKKKEKSKKGKK